MAVVGRGAVASKAGRLLRSVRLLLAREKSYDLSSAEGRKPRGRRVGKERNNRYVEVELYNCTREAGLACAGRVGRPANTKNIES